MMKYFRYLAITAIFWGIAPGANALSIDLDTYDCNSSSDCEALFVPPGPSSPAQEIDRIETAFGVTPGTLSLLYKDDNDSGEDGTAPFADSYSTEYFNSPTDPEDVTISWDGGLDPSISCPECFLYVKDGRQDPNVYMFDLGTLLDLAIWNGTDDLVLTNFWPQQGAISHVAIYGVSPIPVPAAFWLFGTALIGFIGISRRTKV
jgi:hypothetical protein